jgi:hypothetical protein
MTKTNLNWKDFLEEGKNYFLKAKRWSESDKYNKDLIYNMILISIEKNFMAICMKNKYLPENHTISDLVDAVKRVIGIDKELEMKLMEIEKYQNICSVNDYVRETGKIEDINLVVKIGNEVNEFAGKILR